MRTPPTCGWNRRQTQLTGQTWVYRCGERSRSTGSGALATARCSREFIMKFRGSSIRLILFFFVLLSITVVGGWGQDAPPYDNSAPAQENTTPAPSSDNATQPQNNGTLDSAPSAEPGDDGQERPAEGNPADDPSGRVGRLQYMTGSVSVQPHGTDDWVEGSLNRPLTNADNIWADKDSRAEINVGTGTLRIDAESSLTLTNVANDAVQLSLHQGTLDVHLRHLYSGEVYEIDTPNVAFTVKTAGDYRVDVDPNGDTTFITVRRGEGEATGQGPAVVVRAGEQTKFSGGTSLAHETKDAPRPDGFDEWCRTRDQREDSSVARKHVAPGVVGAEDLDDYGSWRDTPDYGDVWVPTAVAPGWAPYTAGNWIWEDPWGWTWVDAYPWGFAPFHYGRWVSFGSYWGWAPGPYWVRPWYAPALVGWFGGRHWGFGVGFGGGFGWCPLGFGEPFYPWYRTSRFYFRNVNISNTRITNITRISNNYYSHGVTSFGARRGVLPRYASVAGRAMSRDNFVRGRSVAGNSFRLSGNDLRGASTLGRLNASPTRESMLGGARGTPVARPSSAGFPRPTVTRMTPPARSSRPANMQAASGGRPGNPRGPGIASSRNLEGTAPRPSENARGSMGTSGPRGMPGNRSVPKPPYAGMPQHQSGAAGSVSRPASRPSAATRSVPRPPESASPAAESARNAAPNRSAEPHSYSSPNTARSVPRPSGRVLPAPRQYSNGEGRGGYATRAYGGYSNRISPGGGYRAYSERPTYDSPYRGRPYSGGGRSYSAPSRGPAGGGSRGGSFGGSSHGGGGFRGGSPGGSRGGSSPHGSMGGHGGHGR